MGRRHKCFVPSCPNSVSKTRDKVFVHVNDHLKRKWCNQLNIVYNPHQRLYCCEDHLNLNEDLENYYQWKLMKATPRLKPTAVLKYTLANESNLENILMEDESHNVQVESKSEPKSELEKILLKPIENISSKKHEKGNDDTCTIASSSSAGPVKIDVATQCDKVTMKNKSTLVKKRVPKPLTTSTTIPKIIESSSTASASPSLYGSTLDDSDSEEDEHFKEKLSREHIIGLIYKNPKMYLGLPKQYLWLIELICKEMLVKNLDILITLMKIKQNDSMLRLADQFALSRPSITNSFYRGITALAGYFQNFVFMPAPDLIKQNLPLVFKIRYSNVQCILDAFEIEIEKPSDPQSQAQTWSQYKHCNTLKYLVGCTPNGFISFLSKGYGGRISDKALVEKSDLMEVLPTNTIIMADRGFKEIESLLATKNIKLLRPPSVYSSNKPTRAEVLETKVIASLRVHIERVIRRIREFKLLKPHSVVSHKHIGYLDKIILIACGLINLQNEIIKQ